MQDPWPAPAALSEATKNITHLLHLTTLPPHVHQVLLSFLFYLSVERVISPRFSRYVFPKHYPKLPLRTKASWDIHFTGFINAIILCSGVFFVMVFDDERRSGTWEERMWSYSGASGAVQAIATGYFMWDFWACLVNYKTAGILDLLHGTVSVVAAFLGFRPFSLYYGLSYLLFELSTPFVHLHWVFDKLNMTGSPAQWYNGVVLIVTFFCCRLLYGPYLSWVFFRDVWTAYKFGICTTQAQFPHDLKPTIMHHSIPLWMAVLFLTANAILMCLNFFWFSKMIDTVRKRFSEVKDGQGTIQAPSSLAMNDSKKKS